MIAMSRPITFVLFTACASLSTLLLREIFGPEKQYPIPIAARSSAPPSLPKVPAFNPPPVDVLVEFNGRPLFNPKRQPIDPFVEMKQVPPPPAPQVTFIGTISQDGKQLAMVKTPEAPLAYTVQVGSALGVWKISDITPERILLAAESATYEVKLNSSPPPTRTGLVANIARNARGAVPSRGPPASISNPVPRPPQPAPLPDQRAHLRGIQ